MAGEPTNFVAKLKESLGNAGWHERVLALEVRPKKYGFVVLEGPDVLLDWGIRSYRNEQIVRSGRFDSLLQSYAPHCVVIRLRRHHSQKAAEAVRNAITEISDDMGRHSIKTRFISWTTIRRIFERRGCKNKHQIHSLLAEWFDEISWKLPARRRPWQSERPNTLLFDALATGVAFFVRSSNGTIL
jgi:hypothetical protein